jgi:hypothetical protein
MHTMKGGCHCGNLRVTAELTALPAAYCPRICDCEFCRKHAAAYVSDPQGSLLIRVDDERAVARYRQGNGLAEMLLCANCGVLIGAVFQDERALYGVVNARVLDGWQDFGARQVVSPKTLSGEQKVSRWQQLWFADVKIDSAAIGPPP